VQNVALFFTAGISDLKFVAKDGRLLELSKDISGKGSKEMASVRTVHEALRALGADKIALWPFDDVPEAVLRFQSGSMNATKVAFFKNAAGESVLDRSPVDGVYDDILLQYLDDGRIIMVADKMRPMWDIIHSQIRVRQVRICAVVGFRSFRDNEPAEPIMAEELIFGKLVERFHATLRYSQLVTYLSGSERLEDEEGDFLPAASDRIERGVRECRSSLTAGGIQEPVEPWLATTGGIPAVKGVLRAAAELHFDCPARMLERPEGTKLASYYHAPQDSLIARRHALKLVEKGDFTGAYAVAQPFEEQELQHYWVKPLGQTALYFDGRLSTASHTPDFLTCLVNDKMPRCIYAAMRTEAALRAERTPEAIIWTSAFLDAALVDHIATLEWVQNVERYGSRLSTKPGTQVPQVLLEPNGGICLEKEPTSGYKYYTGGRRNDRWLEIIGDSQAVTKLFKSFKSKSGEASPREIRNNLLHNAVSVKQMKGAQTIFVRSGLWKDINDSPRFLTADLVRGVFEKLGISPRPEVLYENVTTGLTNILAGPRTK
jgi:hypothetical protein